MMVRNPTTIVPGMILMKKVNRFIDLSDELILGAIFPILIGQHLFKRRVLINTRCR